MMRRSGVSPVVKRWKLCCEIPRRAASGHIAAMQLSKFAAASRIALAVISGWPEAPSSPLHGRGAPFPAGVDCGGVAPPGGGAEGAAWLDFETEPVKILSKKLNGPPPPDVCARAPPHTRSAAASTTAPARPLANGPACRLMLHPLPAKISCFQEALSRFPRA